MNRIRGSQRKLTKMESVEIIDSDAEETDAVGYIERDFLGLRKNKDYIGRYDRSYNFENDSVLAKKPLKKIDREDYWTWLSYAERRCQLAFQYLIKKSLIHDTFAIFNQNITISSIDYLKQKELDEKGRLAKFFRYLCEDNCKFFKDYFFNVAVEIDG